MSGLDAAALFAEISIAITGFVSIFVALGSRDGSFPIEEHIHLKSLVGVSLACVGGGVTPIIVAQFTSVDSQIWGVSSAFGLVFSIALNVWLTLFAAKRHRELTGEPFSNSIVQVVLGLSTLVLYVINISPVMGEPDAGLYLLALFIGLVICAKEFSTSLFRRFLS